MVKISRSFKKMIPYSKEELEHLQKGARMLRVDMTSYIRSASLQHTDYLITFRKKSAQEYIDFQLSDTPEPLSTRTITTEAIETPIMSKDDLIGSENEDKKIY